MFDTYRADFLTGAAGRTCPNFIFRHHIPDHFAGKSISNVEESDDIKIVGLVRRSEGRLNIKDLILQEDDILEFIVTSAGLAMLDGVLGMESL